jgi:predicted transcriptional regulator
MIDKGLSDDRLHMRISADLKKKLRHLARRENRSLSNFIEHVLERHVEADKKNFVG